MKIYLAVTSRACAERDDHWERLCLNARRQVRFWNRRRMLKARCWKSVGLKSEVSGEEDGEIRGRNVERGQKHILSHQVKHVMSCPFLYVLIRIRVTRVCWSLSQGQEAGHTLERLAAHRRANTRG